MSKELRCINCKKVKNHWLYVWNYENEATGDINKIAICLDCYKNADEESRNDIAKVVCNTLMVATELLIEKTKE